MVLFLGQRFCQLAVFTPVTLTPTNLSARLDVLERLRAFLPRASARRRRFIADLAVGEAARAFGTVQPRLQFPTPAARRRYLSTLRHLARSCQSSAVTSVSTSAR